jgi:hypothetical protein
MRPVIRSGIGWGAVRGVRWCGPWSTAWSGGRSAENAAAGTAGQRRRWAGNTGPSTEVMDGSGWVGEGKGRDGMRGTKAFRANDLC